MNRSHLKLAAAGALAALATWGCPNVSPTSNVYVARGIASGSLAVVETSGLPMTPIDFNSGSPETL
ncbi:MAG: hypothetical protein K8I02_09835, partial [Candidatus Methylomirabilis sp.]|nr:hypothetical protein [Deltaproteobacteria bacterium]